MTMPNGSAVRVLTDRQTHTHTDGSVFITSTVDVGGKNVDSIESPEFGIEFLNSGGSSRAYGVDH